MAFWELPGLGRALSRMPVEATWSDSQRHAIGSLLLPCLISTVIRYKLGKDDTEHIEEQY